MSFPRIESKLSSPKLVSLLTEVHLEICSCMTEASHGKVYMAIMEIKGSNEATGGAGQGLACAEPGLNQLPYIIPSLWHLKLHRKVTKQQTNSAELDPS
jgi:hypothetical protein